MDYSKIDVVKLIPSQQSTGEAWETWHRSLRKRFGKKNANMIFLKAWEMRGGAGTDASTVALRNYMKDQGVTLETTTFEGIQDSVSDIGEYVGSFLRLGIGFNVVITIAAFVGLYVGYRILNKKENKQAAVTVFEATPYGQGYKAIKSARK